jgi:hypothetical protein
VRLRNSWRLAPLAWRGSLQFGLALNWHSLASMDYYSYWPRSFPLPREDEPFGPQLIGPDDDGRPGDCTISGEIVNSPAIRRTESLFGAVVRDSAWAL